MEKSVNTCMQCGVEIKGRPDKKFCDDACRNAWHNQQNKEEAAQTRGVNAILRKNRRVLIALNTTGKSKVTKEMMLKQGFNFDYLTRVYTTKKGSTYYFCYEQGYLPLDNDWFMLVVANKPENS